VVIFRILTRLAGVSGC